MKIRKNDTVMILQGKDRGKVAKVLTVFPAERKIVVEGANIHKRHRRPRRAGEKGQIMEVALPFPASNVQWVCPRCGKVTRVGYRIEGERKARFCRKCGETA